jgi:hypothetical protein
MHDRILDLILFAQIIDHSLALIHPTTKRDHDELKRVEHFHPTRKVKASSVPVFAPCAVSNRDRHLFYKLTSLSVH